MYTNENSASTNTGLPHIKYEDKNKRLKFAYRCRSRVWSGTAATLNNSGALFFLRSGASKKVWRFFGFSDRAPRIIKRQGMKLLAAFRRMSATYYTWALDERLVINLLTGTILAIILISLRKRHNN